MSKFVNGVYFGTIVRVGSSCRINEDLTMSSAGYPITTYILDRNSVSTLASTSTTNVTNITSLRGLIDPDTPEQAYTRTGYNDSSKTFKLVFSDEFEQDGKRH